MLLRTEERVTALVLLHHARGSGVAAHVALVALVEVRAVRPHCTACMPVTRPARTRRLQAAAPAAPPSVLLRCSCSRRLAAARR